MIRQRFGAAAHPSATVSREGLPRPDKLAERGITTKESLDWLATRDPKPPAPEYHIDNPDLRHAATASARLDHRALIEKLRADFRNQSAKGRQDFRTAQRYRGHKQGK